MNYTGIGEIYSANFLNGLTSSCISFLRRFIQNWIRPWNTNVLLRLAPIVENGVAVFLMQVQSGVVTRGGLPRGGPTAIVTKLYALWGGRRGR